MSNDLSVDGQRDIWRSSGSVAFGASLDLGTTPGHQSGVGVELDAHGRLPDSTSGSTHVWIVDRGDLSFEVSRGALRRGKL